MLTAPASKRPLDPALPDMDRGTAHVWFACLDATDAVAPCVSGVLSAEEQRRARSFRFERDRRRFLVTRAALRNILGACLGVEPGVLSFRYGRHGKPMLAGRFAESAIRFNVSHSAGCALVGVAHGREIGVDLELVRPLGDVPSLAQSCFSIAESAAWNELPEKARLRGFFDGWTRKEAFVKATGNGLSLSLQSFTVSLAPGAGRRPLTLPVTGDIEAVWTLVSLAPRSDYSAAVAVEGQDCRIQTLGDWWMPCPAGRRPEPLGVQ